MCNINDFVIEDGVLKKYNGGGGDVIIPDCITAVGAWSFARCTSLTGITIPDSVTNIDREAFWECTSLTNVTIPASVTCIDSMAFFGCTSLTRITILPKSVTWIGLGVFDGCDNLTICASKNSFAKKYAKDHKIPFMTID